jgi:transcriptional regulator with XRE-family HTH domain
MITPTQSRMARAALGWSIADLADAAGIGKNTALRMELSGNITLDTMRAIEGAFQKAGILFPAENAVQHQPKT